MRPPTPLPAPLVGRTFTRRQALELGVPPKRLRARDLERVARATYRHRASPTGADPHPAEHGSALLGPDDVELLRMLCARPTAVRASHVTAAQLYRLPLPPQFSRSRPFHLSGLHHSHFGGGDPETVLHRLGEAPDRSHKLCGIPVSPPGELFVELARYLTVPALVELGEQLVRVPRSGVESKQKAWCTLQELRLGVKRGRRRWGIERARQALELVRVGADSVPETRLRLALIDAGLPEPELQIQLDPRDRLSPVGDAGYRRPNLVLQYEGEHHFTAEQQARDQWRNAQFERAGWTVVLANRVDLREGFATTVQRVRTLLQRTDGRFNVSDGPKLAR